MKDWQNNTVFWNKIESCSSNGFGVETTMGVLCKEGKEVIFEIGKRLIDKTSDKTAKNYLIQKLSMSIQNCLCFVVIALWWVPQRNLYLEFVKCFVSLTKLLKYFKN